MRLVRGNVRTADAFMYLLSMISIHCHSLRVNIRICNRSGVNKTFIDRMKPPRVRLKADTPYVHLDILRFPCVAMF